MSTKPARSLAVGQSRVETGLGKAACFADDRSNDNCEMEWIAFCALE